MVVNGINGIFPFRHGFLRESRVRHPNDGSVQHYPVLEAHYQQGSFGSPLTSGAICERSSSGQSLSLKLFSAEPYGAVCRQTSGVSLEEREARLLLLARTKSLQRMMYVIDVSHPCRSPWRSLAKDSIHCLYFSHSHISFGMEALNIVFSCGFE